MKEFLSKLKNNENLSFGESKSAFEIIMEGKNGTIIAPKDIDALTNAMQKFLEEKERWQDANSYRKTIVDRFQQEIVWNALLAEYKTLEAHVC